MKSCLPLLLFFSLAPVSPAQTVRFATTLGDIDVNLLPADAPLTVANFLRYVNRGAYNGTFFHRSVQNFVIQAGGFRWVGGNIGVDSIPEDPPVRNEYKISNTRGTISMAKLGSGPNTATNQWFFNLADNSGNLNTQNGGFTVFGRVANAAGLAVMDRIAAVRIYNAGSPFDSIPLVNCCTGSIQQANLVTVNSITVLNQPQITGVASAGSFGGFTSAAPGSFVEIYGSNLSVSSTRLWSGADFSGNNAPRALDNVSVTVNGVATYVYYISPSQINVQLPAEIPTGGSVGVVVSVNGVASSVFNLPIRQLAGGLLAPPSFKVGDKQYVVAARPATGAFVSNGSIPNVPAAPAEPGETLTLYGIGFGPVDPGTSAYAGQIAQGLSSVRAPFDITIGGISAQVTYAGLAPNLVGLYQFNVVVPPGAASGDQPLQMQLNGEPIAQTLFLSVK